MISLKSSQKDSGMQLDYWPVHERIIKKMLTVFLQVVWYTSVLYITSGLLWIAPSAEKQGQTASEGLLQRRNRCNGCPSYQSCLLSYHRRALHVAWKMQCDWNGHGHLNSWKTRTEAVSHYPSLYSHHIYLWVIDGHNCSSAWSFGSHWLVIYWWEVQ